MPVITRKNIKDCKHRGRCPVCEVQYCRQIALDCVKEIKKILDRKTTVEEAKKRLAKKYPGIGFEN